MRSFWVELAEAAILARSRRSSGRSASGAHRGSCPSCRRRVPPSSPDEGERPIGGVLRHQPWSPASGDAPDGTASYRRAIATTPPPALTEQHRPSRVIGRLPFGAHRRLTRVAADARRATTIPAGPRATSDPGGRRVPTPGVGRWDTELAVGDGRREALTHAVAATVVGPPRDLVDVLSHDATGWCPGFTFTSRADACRALSDAADSLAVHRFAADHLWWFDPVAVVEWILEASVDTPLLVDDDVLVEADRRRLSLRGVSIAELHDDRITCIHTTFDDAALIEQVLLVVGESDDGRSG